MSKHLSRREFLQVSSATAIAGVAGFSAPAAATPAAPATPVGARGPFHGTLCMFSKPVPQLSWAELAKAAKNAGFDGIDLTVREEGHVAPDRAETDLPKAVAAIRAEGLEVPMITTELRTGDEPNAEPILRTASKLSIPYLKPGYYYYKIVHVADEVNEAGRKLRGLVELAGKYGIQVGYHNHTDYIGAVVWDMARVIEPLDPRWGGYYLDVGNLSASCGLTESKVATNLVLPRLKMAAVKDFRWKEVGPHRWHAVTCPLGQGFSPIKEFLQALAQSNFHGPISLHEEYEIPGLADDQGRALSREAIPKVMEAAKGNLAYLRSLVREAYGEAKS
jgi:sugar phosphate isomerase/epimerase